MIVEHTRALPAAPGMKPTRRDPQEPQERSHREVLAGPIHGAQDSQLVASVRQTSYGEAKAGRLQQGEREPEQCRELPHASP